MMTEGMGQLAQVNLQNQNLEASLAESAMNRAVTGLGAAEGLETQPLRYSGMMTQAAAPFQQQEQNSLDRLYQEFVRRQTADLPYIQAGLGLTGQSHQAAYWPQESPWLQAGAGILGMAAGGALGGLLGGPGGAGASTGQTLDQELIAAFG